MQPFKKILVPIDFSESSKQALEDAIAIAEGLGSELLLLHAYENPDYVLPMSGYVGPTADMLSRLREQLTSELEELAKAPREKGLTTQVQLVEGVAYRVVVDTAGQWGANLIVMGTHGRTGLSHALTGSVAERVVRVAPCPVLVSRRPS